MPPRARPLSPHLQVYRWQIGNTLSILHRMTGIALAFGLIGLCYWLISLASGAPAYSAALRNFASPLGLLCLVGWTFAFSYHLLNGVRHLFWDAGKGFERRERRLSGWVAVFGSAAVTVGVWAFLLHAGRFS